MSKISAVSSLLVASLIRERIPIRLPLLLLWPILFISWVASYYVVWRFFIYPRYLSPLRHLPSIVPGNNLRAVLPILGEKQQKLDEDIELMVNRYPEAPLLRTWTCFNETVIVVSTKSCSTVHLNHYLYQKPEGINRFLRRILGPNGLLTVEGDVHKYQRKAMSSSFAYGHLKSITPIFQEKAAKLVKVWNEEVAPEGKTEIAVADDIRRTTLEVICSAGLGYDMDYLSKNKDRKNDLASAYESLFDFSRLNPLLVLLQFFVPQVRKLPFGVLKERADHIANITHIAESIVDTKSNLVAQNMSPGSDLMAILVSESAKKQKVNDPEDPGMSLDDLRDQTMTLMAAGHETTSAALSAALKLLSTHSDIQNKLRDELLNSKHDSFEAIESLKYLHNVVREVLRIMPPVQVTLRTPVEDAVLEGVSILKNTNILIPIQFINTNALLWGDDSKEFRPDRWNNLPSTVDTYSVETFAHGARTCIAQKFAYLEMKVILSAIITNFELASENPEGHIIWDRFGGTKTVLFSKITKHNEV